MSGGFSRRRDVHFEPPVEMRFVDLFMIIVVTLMFITVMLIIFSASIGAERVEIAPTVSTRALPDALVDQSYNLTLAGTGGASPYTWRIVKGTLPKGLALAPGTDVISGVPEVGERQQFTVEMADAEKRSVERELSLEVRYATKQETSEVDQIRVPAKTLMLPDATGSTSYTFHFDAEGGNPPYAWRMQTGKLPQGLELTPSGDLIGIPSAAESSSEFTVAITDAIGANATQNARILVLAPPTPWWKWTLSWVVYILGWTFTIVGALVVSVILFVLSEGVPPEGPRPARPGWKGLRRRLAEKYR